MHPTRAHPTRKGIITPHPLLLLPLLLFLASLAWRGVVYYQGVQIAQQYHGSVTRSPFNLFVSGPLTSLAIAGLVGTLAYWLFQRSQRAAQIGVGLVLAIITALYAYGNYNNAQNLEQTRARLAEQEKQAARTAEWQQHAQDLAIQNQNSMRAMQEKSAAEMERLRRDADATQQALRNGQTPPPRSGLPPPSSPSTSPPSQPAPAPPPPQTQSPAEPPDTVSPPIVDAMRAELKPVLSDAATQAENAVKIASKPKRTRKDLDEQIAALAIAKESLTAAEKTLKGVRDQLAQRLKDAGVDSSRAMTTSIEFERTLGPFDKRVAASQLARLCDSATELLTLLRDNVGKWTMDSQGAITSKDKSLGSKLFGPIHQTQFAVEQAGKNIESLKAD